MLKLTVDSLDAIDEPLRSLYEENEGKFRLKVDGVEDTSGLRSALEKERKAARDLEKRVKKWEALGKSEEEIQALLSAAEQAEHEKASKAGEWEKLRAQMNEKHEAALRAEADKSTKMRATLERYLVDAAATTAIAAAKGVPELLLPHVQRHVKVVEEDGDFVARVVDAKGDPRVNSKGEHMTISDLVGEMRQSEVFGRAFESSGNAGSGKQPGNGAGGAGATRKSDFKSEKDRAAYVEKHGVEAYRNLPN
jgi:hypothetical protein